MIAGGIRKIEYKSKSDVFSIWNLADLHLLNKGCERGRLAADIQKIKDDPFSYWFGGGDYGEYISVDDKRYDPSCVPNGMTPMELGSMGATTINVVKTTLEPISSKCLGLLFGNHEHTYMKTKEQAHLHSWLCHELGVANLEYSALVDLSFKQKAKGSGHQRKFRFYLHHGAGGAQTPGGKLNRLVKFMQAFEADIYMIGHVHDQLAKRLPSIGANATCTALKEKVKLGIITGSYLRTFTQDATTYGERFGYSPCALGMKCVKVKPYHGEFWAEV